VAVLITGAAMAVDVAHNFFDWDPGTGPERADGIALSVYAVSIWLTVWLLRRTRGRIRSFFAAVAVAALFVLGVGTAGAEAVTEGWLFARDRPSPWGYRVGRAILMAVPFAIAAGTALRRWTVSRRTAAGPDPSAATRTGG
jgi:cytochrome bd-type quinol oxidase subunit 2